MEGATTTATTTELAIERDFFIRVYKTFHDLPLENESERDTLKALLKHWEFECSNDKNCIYPNCILLTKLLEHERLCKDELCIYCLPIKYILLKMKLKKVKRSRSM